MNSRGLARALVAKLPKSLLYEIFYQSARALGVRNYQAIGSVGSFFGPVYDQSVTRTYLEKGAWSENIVSLFAHFFENGGGTMYDIGANIGLVSIPLAKNPDVHVVAFEPDPENCSLLRANIAVAGVTVEVVNAAVADQPGTLQFTRSDYNSGDHRLSSDGGLTVTSVTLDQYPPPAGRFGIKIDTQGAEPLIFQGGETVLAQAGLIVSEFWPWGMTRMGLDPRLLLTFAERHFTHGLTLRHDQAPGQAMPVATVIAQLEKIMQAAGKNDAVDLVLMR